MAASDKVRRSFQLYEWHSNFPNSEEKGNRRENNKNDKTYTKLSIDTKSSDTKF